MISYLLTKTDQIQIPVNSANNNFNKDDSTLRDSLLIEA